MKIGEFVVVTKMDHKYKGGLGKIVDYSLSGYPIVQFIGYNTQYVVNPHDIEPYEEIKKQQEIEGGK